MNRTEIIRISWNGLTSNRVRSLLTMLGVIIGVAAVIIMIAVSAGTEATIAEQIESLGTNLLFVTPGNFGTAGVSVRFEAGGSGGPSFRGNIPGLVYDDAIAISKLSGVAAVAIERNTSQVVKFGSTASEGVNVIGTAPGYLDVRNIDIAAGRFFTQQETERKTKVAVLGSTLAKDLFGTESPIGQKIYVGTVQFTVVGLTEAKGVVGQTDYDSRLYVPITVVFDKFTPSQFARVIGDRINSVTVEVADLKNMDSVITQIQLLLAKRYDTTVENLQFTINTQQDMISTRESTTEAFRSLLGWVAAVSLVVGGIGIMNIMLVSVTERTREIGIRQSVGATPGDIRWQFLIEALLLSLTGGLIGVLAGVGGSWIFARVADMRTVVMPASILLAFGSAAAVGIFFGYYPANKAAQLDPIDALRHE